jgi:hypothetical protein
MKFYYTQNFKIRLEKLFKKDIGHCRTCPTDISNDLAGLNFQEIFKSSTNIIEDYPIFLLKRRVANSGRKLSKSSGYRLHIIIDVVNESITLCDIYPKKGKFGQENLKPNERYLILENYADELEAGVLKALDIYDIMAIL